MENSEFSKFINKLQFDCSKNKHCVHLWKKENNFWNPEKKEFINTESTVKTQFFNRPKNFLGESAFDDLGQNMDIVIQFFILGA